VNGCLLFDRKQQKVGNNEPEVGSSRKRIDGSVIISMPMLTRFRCPPEMPRCSALPILVLWHFSRPSSSMSASTLAFLLRSVRGSLSCAENQNVSRGVSIGYITSSCPHTRVY
jgi:hypothetical protein